MHDVTPVSSMLALVVAVDDTSCCQEDVVKSRKPIKDQITNMGRVEETLGCKRTALVSFGLSCAGGQRDIPVLLEHQGCFSFGYEISK